MRYAPLKSLTKSTTLQVSLPRVLPPIILKDLFNKFVLKVSAITLNPPSLKKQSPAPQPKKQLPKQVAPYEEHT